MLAHLLEQDCGVLLELLSLEPIQAHLINHLTKVPPTHLVPIWIFGIRQLFSFAWKFFAITLLGGRRRDWAIGERGFSCLVNLALLPACYANARATDGSGIASRLIRSKIVVNNSLCTATSASWKVTCFACRVTFAPILMKLWKE